MHFLVFMYLLIASLGTFFCLLGVVVTFVEGVIRLRWKWAPLHLITGIVLVFVLHHFVDLMVKFVNA